MNQARQTARLPNKDRFKGLEFVGRMTECDAGQEAFATVSRASNWAGSAPNKIARKLIASFRIAANCGNAMQTQISAPKRPVDLGLRDPFLRVSVHDGLFADPGISRDRGSANASRRTDVMSQSKEPANSNGFRTFGRPKQATADSSKRAAAT